MGSGGPQVGGVAGGYAAQMPASSSGESVRMSMLEGE